MAFTALHLPCYNIIEKTPMDRKREENNRIYANIKNEMPDFEKNEEVKLTNYLFHLKENEGNCPYCQKPFVENNKYSNILSLLSFPENYNELLQQIELIKKKSYKNQEDIYILNNIDRQINYHIERKDKYFQSLFEKGTSI